MRTIGNIQSFSFTPSKFLIGLLLSCFLLFALRIEIMRGIAHFLICETTLPPSADAVVVLSGSPYDRANKASTLQKQTSFPIFICTGKNQSADLKVLGDSIYECDLLKRQLMHQGVAENSIHIMKEGTSTAEEAEALLEYAKKHHCDSFIVVSSKFHTRRVKNVFVKKFKEQNIHIFIQGASSSSYDEENWWKSEYGLIALNNEYIKLMYYLIK